MQSEEVTTCQSYWEYVKYDVFNWNMLRVVDDSIYADIIKKRKRYRCLY